MNNDVIELVLKSEIVRDELRKFPADTDAVLAANVLTFYRRSALETGTIEFSLLAGAVHTGETVLRKLLGN